MPLNLAPSPTEALSDAINRLIDDALQKDNASRPPRTYLGASRLGEECSRQLWYEYHQSDKREPFEGRILRRFRMGHMHEGETSDWLILAGFDLRRPIEGDPRFEFFTEDGKLGGHIDGVLCGGPAEIELPWPLLWEHKIMKASVWRATKKHGVEIEHPTYYGQQVVYDYKLGLRGSLFTALNTDTSELLFEYVPPNHGKARELLELKGRRIVDSPNEGDMPRIAATMTDYRCKLCDFQAHCWRKTEQPKHAPAWAPWLKV